MENAQELIQRLNHSGKKLSKSHRRIAECIVYTNALTYAERLKVAEKARERAERAAAEALRSRDEGKEAVR